MVDDKAAEASASGPDNETELITRDQYRDNLGGQVIEIPVTTTVCGITRNQLMKRRLAEGPKRPNWFIRFLFGG